MITEVPPICELVDSATSAVLEAMFMTGVEMAGEWTEETPGNLAVGLRFAGALNGEFQLHLQEGTALSLASTMLCLEGGELRPEHAGQLAAELTNMICGSLLSHLAPEGLLTLGTPAPIQSVTPMLGGTNRRFDLPEGSLAVAFRLDGEQDSAPLLSGAI